MADDEFTNQHGQRVVGMSSRELAIWLIRDAVGCLTGAADALLADPDTTYSERLAIAHQLAALGGYMNDVGGQDRYTNETSLTERQEGVEELYHRLQAGVSRGNW